MKRLKSLFVSVLLGSSLAGLCAAQPLVPNRPEEKKAPADAGKDDAPYFQILMTPLATNGPYTGRLTVYVLNEKSGLPADLGPGDGPFFDAPQPMFSMWVDNLKVGDQIKFRDELFFPHPLKDLPAGRYRAQAVLDRNAQHSSWQKEATNSSSPYVNFEVRADRPKPFVRFEMVDVGPRPMPPYEGVELFEMRSELLSSFHGAETTMKAGVVFPVNYDASRAYPAVYWVHGFPTTAEWGGDFGDAWIEGHHRARRARFPDDTRYRETHEIWKDAFLICLDANGPNGHTLLADSDNNGPMARALVEEFVPALEKKYRLIPDAEARALRGHSSGGWSAVWLTMHHPTVFGQSWAGSPDPVDFRAFQAGSVYDRSSMFVDADGNEIPSYRVGDSVRMTVRTEAAMERVLGPEGQGAQQWASWMAVFGPRGAGGAPKPLFDLQTGEVDRSVAKAWGRYDIAALVRENPTKYGPVFRDRIRIIAGGKDNFYLNRAVEGLGAELDKIGARNAPGRGGGYIEIRPNEDHGGAMSEESLRQIYNEILMHFRAKGFAK